MDLVLSWNLFIIVIFVVIIAYSFIIGLNRTLKTIIGTYLAVLAADGLGNILNQLFLDSPNFDKFLSVFQTSANETLIIMKVLIFVAVVVILSVRGAFEVNSNAFNLGGANVFVNGIFGFLSAGLILSTLLAYVSGLSFVQNADTSSNILDLYTNSTIVKFMVDYYNYWFSIPVVALILWSLFFKAPEEGG